MIITFMAVYIDLVITFLHGRDETARFVQRLAA